MQVFCPHCRQKLKQLGQVSRFICDECKCIFNVKITVEFEEVANGSDEDRKCLLQREISDTITKTSG